MMCEYHKAAASNNEFEPAAETKQAIDDTSRVASGNSISSRLQHDPLPFEINLDHAFKCADDNGFNGKAIAHQTDEGHDVTLLSSSFDVAQQLDTLDCSSACGPTPSPTADSRTFPVSTITMNSATDPIIDDNDFTSL